jgi:hypothetical protein
MYVCNVVHFARRRFHPAAAGLSPRQMGFLALEWRELSESFV